MVVTRRFFIFTPIPGGNDLIWLMLKPPPSISFLKKTDLNSSFFNLKNWLVSMVSMEFPALGWFHDPHWKSVLDSIVPHNVLYPFGQMNPFSSKAMPGTRWPFSVNRASRRHHVSLGPILPPTKSHQLSQAQIDWWNIYIYMHTHIYILYREIIDISWHSYS